jgi:PhnB protein
MTCNPYLSFNGNCREAFQRYEQVLGGRIVMMMTHGEMPDAPEMPPETRDAIMHARLEFDGQVLMGGDAPGGRFKTPTGFCVTLGVETVERAAAIFNALAEGGTTQMPFQDTFWAAKFGMVTDRFGIPWIINGEPRV